MNLVGQAAFAFVFALLCWGAGGFLLHRFLPRDLPPLGRLVVNFAAGNVIFSYVITALGIAGLIAIDFLIGLLALAGLLTIWHLRKYWRSGPPPARPAWTDLTLALVFLVFSVPAVLIALAPPFMRDTLVYHLAMPKNYIATHALTYTFENFYSAFPKGYEMLLTLLLNLAGDRAAQLFSVFQELAAVFGIYVLVAAKYEKITALICAIGYATIPTAVYYSGCGYVEPSIALALVSTLLLLSAYARQPSGALAFLCGLPAGWLMSLKYTGVLYLGLLGLVLAYALRQEKPKRAVGQLGLYLLAALPGTFWMARNWVVLGNPVYPLAYDIFGGRGWDAERALTYQLFFHNYGMGHAPLDYLLVPYRASFFGFFNSIRFDGYMGPFMFLFLGLSILVPLLRHKQRTDDGPVPGLGYALLAAVAFFIFGTQQVRFYLPAQLLACVYAAPVVAAVVSRGRQIRIVPPGLALIVGAILLLNGWVLWMESTKLACYRPLLGLETAPAFLAREAPGFPAIDYLNTHTPPNAKVLCVWTGNYGYYFNRAFVADALVENITLKKFLDAAQDGADLDTRLRGAGFTHLLVNFQYLNETLSEGQFNKLQQFLLAKRPKFKFGNLGFVVIEL